MATPPRPPLHAFNRLFAVLVAMPSCGDGSATTTPPRIAWWAAPMGPVWWTAAVDRVEIASAHHERAIVRVGDVYVKIETDPERAQRERIAMMAAPVPTPAVLWWHEGTPSLLALAAVPGTSLAKLGEPTPHPPGVWRRAGAIARQLHDAPVPAGLERPSIKLAATIDELRSWVLENSPAAPDLVDAVASIAHDALDGRDHEPVFTHCDFQAEHVIIDGQDVAAVIDWSESGPGDPLRDLAVLTQGHGEHLDAVLAGYDAPVDRDVIRAYWALGKLNGIRFMISHGFDASGDLAGLVNIRRG